MDIDFLEKSNETDICNYAAVVPPVSVNLFIDYGRYILHWL